MNKSIRKIYEHKNIPAQFHEISLSAIEDGHFSNPHWHEGIEIFFVKQGIIETLINDKAVQKKSGDIFLVNPGTLHSTRTVTKEAVYYCLIANNDICEKFGFSLDGLYMQSKTPAIRLFTLIEEIKNEFLEEREFYTSVVTAKILEIFAKLLRDLTFEKKPAKPDETIEAIKKAIAYIDENFTKKITVDDAAQAAGYSKYYFCHSFSKITRTTVNAYINKLRIDYAAELLKDGVSVTEAAEKCGFSDISYFTKAFKKHTSKTPSQFKSRP